LFRPGPPTKKTPPNAAFYDTCMYPIALVLVLLWFGAAAVLSVGLLRIYVLYRYRQQSYRIQDCVLFTSDLLVLVSVPYATSELMLPTLPLPSRVISFHMKYGYVGYILMVTALWSSKALLASTYCQVFTRLDRWGKLITIITIGYLALSYVAVFLLTLFYCGSPRNNWDISKVCYAPNEAPHFIAYAVLTASGDIFLMITGFMILHELQLMQSRGKKIGVAVVTTIGLMSLCSSFVRWGITAGGLGFSVSAIDARMLLFWFGLESVSAMVACRLPILRAQVRILRNARKKYKEDRVELNVGGRRDQDEEIMAEVAISAEASVRSFTAAVKQ